MSNSLLAKSMSRGLYDFKETLVLTGIAIKIGNVQNAKMKNTNITTHRKINRRALPNTFIAINEQTALIKIEY